MKIDRSIQLGILEILASFYPYNPPHDLWQKLLSLADNDENILISNLFYLHEQGCISKNSILYFVGNPSPQAMPQLIQITHIGLDVLQGDGGLSAIRNTITVRFHEDALAFLEKCVLQGTGTPEKKSALLEKLRNLSGTALEHLMKKALDEAVHHIPDGYKLIETLIS